MNTLDALFSWFTFATVRGTLLALGVLALQAALRGRLPARWHYALWLPVVLVLAAPWLPQSRWSLENRFAPAVARVEPTPLASAFEDGTLLTEVAPVAVPAARTDWHRIAKLAWLAGTAGALFLALAAYARTMRRMRRGEVPADATLLAMIADTALASGLRCPPRVLVSSAVQSPAVTGIWHPLLLLPTNFPDAFTPAEARLVLLHELAHLKRGDLPLNWLFCLLQAIHWCNPVLWFVFARIRTDREAACDAHVLTLTGADSRATYGHALLKLESSLTTPGFSLGFVGIFERTAGLRARLRAIADHRRAHPAWGVFAAGLIAALTLAGATRAQAPIPSKPPASPERRVGGSEQIQKKLSALIIPRLELRDATVQEALNFLQRKSIDLDGAEPDPAKRGVKIVLNLAAPLDPTIDPPTSPANMADARLTVALTNIPLMEALRYVTGLANLKFRIGANAVEVIPQHALAPPPGQEVKVPPSAPVRSSKPPSPPVAPLAPSDPRKKITDKLNTIIIPQLDLRDATLHDAVAFLVKKSAELDVTEPDPAKRGINMVVQHRPAPVAPPSVPGLEPAPQPAEQPAEPRITVSVKNLPLMEALRYVTGLVDMKFKVEPHLVSILPINAGAGALITKEFQLDARSINTLGLARNPDPKVALAEKRVNFPAGAAATWNRDLRRLVIRNTQENLDVVERLVEGNP